MEVATPHLYAIGIGSNRRHHRHGPPAGVVEAAIEALERHFLLFDASSILLNPAMQGMGRDFANAVAIVESDLPPEPMLDALKAMERDFGRRGGRRWGERVLDLDILAWDGGTYASNRLVIPHPGLDQRRFALGPLAQIAPDWRPSGNLTFRHKAFRLGRAKKVESRADPR